MNYKKFEDYEDYIIFKTGKVFSLKRNIFMKPFGNGQGYLILELCKKGHKMRNIGIHRLLGLLFIPNPENKPSVDHINRIRSDNRLINLRWATRKEQNDNQKRRKDNTSGSKGVSFHTQSRTWRAYIMVNGKVFTRNCGSKEEAIAYRRVLEIKYLGEDYLVGRII